MVRGILPFLLLSLLYFVFNPFKLLVPHEHHEWPSGDPTTSDFLDRGVEQLFPVELKFQLSDDDISKFDFRWKVLCLVDESGDDLLLVSSSNSSKGGYTPTTDSENEDGRVSVLFNFTLLTNKAYTLVFKNHVEDTNSEKSKLVHQNENEVRQAHVSIFWKNVVLLSVEGLSLDGRTHVLPFRTAFTTSSDDKRRLVDAPTPQPYSGPNRKTLPPYTLQPRPPKPPEQPPQGAPQSAPQQAPQQLPQQAPQQAPQLAPQQGGNGGDATSSSPSWSGGTKPPSFSDNITSSEPSSSPSVEVPCLSTTNGPVPLEDNYIAIQIDVPQLASANKTIDDFLVDIIDAYNEVATCDQKGALRQIDQAFLVRVNEGTTDASSVFEWIVQLTGVCDGCIDGAEAVFTVSPFTNQEDSTSSSSTRNATDWGVDDINGTMIQSSRPCFCPGPLISTFQDELNEIMQQANITETSRVAVTVVELENAVSCNPLLVDDNITPEKYNTLVTLVVADDPADMTETELESLFALFKEVVHSHLSLTYPTCDLSRKRILDIQRDSNYLRRKLRPPRSDYIQNPQRKVQQSSANFELVLNVAFTCFGCEGRLFGPTNFTPSFDCLCPTNSAKFGIEEKEILLALNDVIHNQRDVPKPILDVIEIEPVPCSSTVNQFSTVVVIEYMLKSNETTPTDDDLVILEHEFVAGYNGMARRYCDPYFRRISSATTFPNYEISNDGLTLNVEMSIVGTCRGNCTSDLSIYDPNAFFISLSATGVTTVVSTNTARSQHRQLQAERELDSTCYCSKAASKVLGPSEPEIVQNFHGLVETLSLESIRVLRK